MLPTQFFDDDSYKLQFKSVFTVSKMKKAFIAKLKNENKENLYFFVEEVDAFEKLEQPKPLIKKLDQIYKKYIDMNSSQRLDEVSETISISIGKLHTEQLNPIYSKMWVLNEQPNEVFAEAKKVVNYILQKIYFEKFQKTDECYDIIKQYPRNDPKLFSPKTVFNYTNEDFFEPNLSENDWNFMKDLIYKSFEWPSESLKSEKALEATTSFTNHNFIPDVTLVDKVCCVKFDYALPFSFERTMNVLSSIDNISQLDPNHQRVKVLKEHKTSELKKKFPKWKNPRGYIEIEADMQFPFPMTESRKFFHVLGWDYDSNTSTLFKVVKPYVNESVKGLNYSEKIQCEFHTKNGIEIKDCYLFWTYSIAAYRKIGENTTQVTSLNIVSTNGWGNIVRDKIGMQLFSHKRGAKQVELMINAMENSEENLSLKNLNLKDYGNYLINNLNIREEDKKFEENLQKLDDDVREKVQKNLEPGNRIDYSLDFDGYRDRFGA
eukprot:gene9214-1300_t